MNYKVVISYDGSRFGGWQKQTNTRETIQETIETVISEVLGEKVDLIGSGRTDAGVHALGQVASFRLERKVSQSLDTVMLKLNVALPSDIVILDLAQMDERFHARYNVKGKKYRYRILNSDKADPFRRKYTFYDRDTFDLAKMREAAGYLVGSHDFRAFSTAHRTKKTTVRELFSVEVKQVDDEIWIEYFGNGFLFNQVRIMTGTLVEVAVGNRDPKDILALFEETSREKSGFTISPRGLFLTEVVY